MCTAYKLSIHVVKVVGPVSQSGLLCMLCLYVQLHRAVYPRLAHLCRLFFLFFFFHSYLQCQLSVYIHIAHNSLNLQTRTFWQW